MEANRAAGIGWSGFERSGFVTRVTRLRELLKACREALRDGETKRADRILAATLQELARLGGVDW
jgi:hypothetical protein